MWSFLPLLLLSGAEDYRYVWAITLGGGVQIPQTLPLAAGSRLLAACEFGFAPSRTIVGEGSSPFDGGAGGGSGGGGGGNARGAASV